VELNREYEPFLSKDDDDRPPLHPTLVALSMVLHCNGDLGTINRTYPDRHKHAYYKDSAVFPNDISDLLPPSADRWWEHLGTPIIAEVPLSPCLQSFNEKLK